jgi:molybdopterin synthase catalytic subunit
MVTIQQQDFSVESEVKALRARSGETGAIVTFTGLVRDISESDTISELYLEHYSGMTEKSIEAIVDEARSRWKLIGTRVIHRVGQLLPSEQIVLVAVSSQHRKDAFLACEFIMDYLKTRAPFWKKERTQDGERWLGTKNTDFEAADLWSKEEEPS